jgi:hypothetical protein
MCSGECVYGPKKADVIAELKKSTLKSCIISTLIFNKLLIMCCTNPERGRNEKRFQNFC